jgi:hypothetical protein
MYQCHGRILAIANTNGLPESTTRVAFPDACSATRVQQGPNQQKQKHVDMK